MSSDSSICKHCGELILLLGFHWIHSKSQQSACEPALCAEPIERLLPEASDQSAYQQGVNDGRRSALVQQRKSNLYRGPLSGIAKEILARAFTERFEDVKRIESICESPIEEMFALTAILEASLTYDESLRAWVGTNVAMVLQQPVGPYRADFLFDNRLVVEIDGHDFHDRDQEQASSDRKRDRDLLIQGYMVVRFTGSDIYGAPLRCVSEVLDLLGKVRIDVIR